MASCNDDSEQIYGNSDAILFHQLAVTGKLLSALQNPGECDGAHGGREEKAECDEYAYVGHVEADEYDDYYDSFSSGEEETEDTDQKKIAPPEEENTQQIQDENLLNVQGKNCDENGYLMSRSLSSGGVNSKAPPNLPIWPPKPQPPSSQLSQGCGAPWKLRPTNIETTSAVNGVFSQPPNNDKSPDKPLVDYTKRGPMPIPGQRRDFQNKAFPDPPDSPARPPHISDKFGLSKSNIQGTSGTDGSTVRPNRFGPQRQSLRVSQENSGAKSGPPPIISPQVNKQQDTLAQQRQLKNSVNVNPNVPVNSSPTRCGLPPQKSNNNLVPPRFAPPTPTAFVKLENGEKVPLTPLYKRIMDKPYFHLVSREYAKKLTTLGGAGAFLIRPSRKTDNPLTITINSGSGNFHVNVRLRPDNLFALGSERRDELTFSSIDEIVDTHYNTPIVLSSGASLTLKHSPMRTGNAYVQHSVPSSRGNRA